MIYKLYCDTRSGLWLVMLETISTGEWRRVFSSTTKDTCQSWMRDNPLPTSESERIHAENLARVTSDSYRRAERGVAQKEKAIRTKV